MCKSNSKIPVMSISVPGSNTTKCRSCCILVKICRLGYKSRVKHGVFPIMGSYIGTCQNLTTIRVFPVHHTYYPLGQRLVYFSSLNDQMWRLLSFCIFSAILIDFILALLWLKTETVVLLKKKNSNLYISYLLSTISITLAKGVMNKSPNL